MRPLSLQVEGNIHRCVLSLPLSLSAGFNRQAFHSLYLTNSAFLEINAVWSLSSRTMFSVRRKAMSDWYGTLRCTNFLSPDLSIYQCQEIQMSAWLTVPTCQNTRKEMYSGLSPDTSPKPPELSCFPLVIGCWL